MDRSEPSLVPEWLKGVSGGGHHTQQPPHQVRRSSSVGTSTGGDRDRERERDRDRERERERERERQPSFERAGASGFSGSHGYTGFGRSNSLRYDANERGDREREREREGGRGDRESASRGSGLDRERDYRDKERDIRDRERVLSYSVAGGDDRDRDRDRERDRERHDGVSPYRPPSRMGRSDGEGHSRRLSTGAGAGSSGSSWVDEGSAVTGSGSSGGIGADKKMSVVVGDVSGLSSAMPTTTGSFASTMQKAAFDRNFPSLLGAQERPLFPQVGGTVAGPVPVVVSPRPLWQSSSLRSQGETPTGRVGGGGSGGGSGEWSSALADVPSSVLGVLPSSSTGVTGVGMASSGSLVAGTTLAVSQNAGPRLADSLQQTTARSGRGSSQSVVETQRLEELALKQSRQLIPMTPSLPKNLVQGLSPREKPKGKGGRTADGRDPPVITVTKPAPSSNSTQSSAGALYRVPSVGRSDSTKLPPSKLQVRRIPKEAPLTITSVAAVLATRQESPTIGSVSAGAPPPVLSVGTAGTPVVSVGASVASTAGVPSVVRKPIQLLDRHALPIAPTSSMTGGGSWASARNREGTKTAGAEEKRSQPSQPQQNKSDFFNELRKKAMIGNVGTSGRGGANGRNGEERNGGEKDAGAGKNSRLDREGTVENGKRADGNVVVSGTIVIEKSSTGAIGLANGTVDDKGRRDCGESEESNGMPLLNGSEEGTEAEQEQSDVVSEETAPYSRNPVGSSLGVGHGSEEEEAAFLKSLGWTEPEESAEGPLTEEEINAFYKETGRPDLRMNTVVRLRNHCHHAHSYRLNRFSANFILASTGVSSDLSSSDSESD